MEFGDARIHDYTLVFTVRSAFPCTQSPERSVGRKHVVNCRDSEPVLFPSCTVDPALKMTKSNLRSRWYPRRARTAWLKRKYSSPYAFCLLLPLMLPHVAVAVWKNPSNTGALGGIRTPDPQIRRRLLSHNGPSARSQGGNPRDAVVIWREPAVRKCSKCRVPTAATLSYSSAMRSPGCCRNSRHPQWTAPAPTRLNSGTVELNRRGPVDGPNASVSHRRMLAPRFPPRAVQRPVHAQEEPAPRGNCSSAP